MNSAKTSYRRNRSLRVSGSRHLVSALNLWHQQVAAGWARAGWSREIRRRTRVVGAFRDGQSALNLAAARLRHIAGTTWSTKRYLNVELLKYQQMRGAITA